MSRVMVRSENLKEDEDILAGEEGEDWGGEADWVSQVQVSQGESVMRRVGPSWGSEAGGGWGSGGRLGTTIGRGGPRWSGQHAGGCSSGPWLRLLLQIHLPANQNNHRFTSCLVASRRTRSYISEQPK